VLAFKLGDNLNFGLHILQRLDLLRVEVHLTGVSAHQLEYIVEHKVLEAIVDWDFHVHDEGSSLDVVRNLFSISYEKVVTIIIQISDEGIHVSPGDITSGFRVVFAPELDKGVNVVLSDRELEGCALANEGIHNDSDEQVEEDERDHNHEGEEVDSGNNRFAAAVRNTIISLNRLIGGVLIALEGNAPGPHGVSHNSVPGFTRSAPQQQQECTREGLEVGVLIQIVLELDHTELRNAYNSEQEEEEHHQGAQTSQGR